MNNVKIKSVRMGGTLYVVSHDPKTDGFDVVSVTTSASGGVVFVKVLDPEVRKKAIAEGVRLMVIDRLTK